MEKELDDYCQKIFATLLMMDTDEKIRFNDLYRKLNIIGAKISRPTLIEHLNHLTKQKIILRQKEDKQKVTYQLNWKKLEELLKTKEKYSAITDQIMKNSKNLSIEQLISKITELGLIAELFYIKYSILTKIEQNREIKFLHYLTYTYIRRLYNIPVQNLIDMAIKTTEDSKTAIESLDKKISKLSEIPNLN
jgi:DNA-binding HxlR family transcriptional regulator